MSKIKTKVSGEKINKSAMIRQVADMNPGEPPRVLVKCLKQQGVSVSCAVISTVLSTYRKHGGVIGRPGRPPNDKRQKATAVVPSSKTAMSNPDVDLLDTIVQIKKLSLRLGGSDRLVVITRELAKASIIE